MAPSERLIVPSFACTAESLAVCWPPEGAASGTQIAVQLVVHLTLEPLSMLFV